MAICLSACGFHGLFQCAHMTVSVKCGFGWQRKESLYLQNSKRLHATALRGENAKLACHSLVEMSFPCVWWTGSIFSYKKICSFAISMAPARLSLFFNNALLQLNFLFFLGRGSLMVGGLFLFPESTRLHIWFHARKIQAFSCCWFGWSGVGPLIPTGLPKSRSQSIPPPPLRSLSHSLFFSLWLCVFISLCPC